MARKKKLTLADFFNRQVAVREAIVWNEILAAHKKVLDNCGPIKARIVLEYFFIPRLEELPILRYSQFLIVCEQVVKEAKLKRI